MSTHVDKDIFHVENGYLVHQVNGLGAMAAGLAKAVSLRWPVVKRWYVSAVEAGELKLGDIQVISVGPSLYVVNLVGQHGYGRDKRYTDYAAVEAGLKKLVPVVEQSGLPVYFPYLMGCGLGGGSWKVVESLIDRYLPQAIICHL